MMLELTPSLSVTIEPLTRAAGGDARRAVARAAELGYRAVQLSAAQRGMRPRELDRRARRDVGAMLGRAGVMLSGLDLMIPHDDWLDAASQDRAVAAALGAIELAADLGRVPLAMTLPIERLAEDVSQQLVTAADGRGVMLAVHAEHDLGALRQWLGRHDHPQVRMALDPAALLAEGGDPAEAVTQHAAALGLARLDDHVRTSAATLGGRCALGAGRLDVLEYRAALATAERLRGLVVELRGLADPLAGAQRAMAVWEETGLG